MVSEVKSIMSSDMADLDSYCPDDYENFAFSLTITVGLRGSDGGDNFDVLVCSPKWLIDEYPEEIISGRGKIIVPHFDMKWILARVKRFFDGRNGKDWNEIAMGLSRIGHWEFEDYQGYKKPPA